MDELAAAAGADAVDFRLRYLPDARAREVLKAAAEKAGWDTRPSWQGGQATTGRGTRGSLCVV